MSVVAKDFYRSRFFEAAPKGLPGFEKPRIAIAASIFNSPEGKIEDLLHGQVVPLPLNSRASYVQHVKGAVAPLLDQAQPVSAILAGEASPDRYGTDMNAMQRSVAVLLYPQKLKVGRLSMLSAELLTVAELDSVQPNLPEKLLAMGEGDSIVGSEIFLAFSGEIKSSIGNTLGIVGCAATIFHVQNDAEQGSAVRPVIHAVRFDTIAAMEAARHINSVGTATALERIAMLRPYYGGKPS
jgi:hypothetical protein